MHSVLYSNVVHGYQLKIGKLYICFSRDSRPLSPGTRSMKRKISRILENQEEEERNRRTLLEKIVELEKKFFWREVETVDPEELGLPLRSVKQVLHFDKDIENQEMYRKLIGCKLK